MLLLCYFAKRSEKNHLLLLRLQLLTDLHLPVIAPFLPLGSLPSSWLRSPATGSTHPPFTSSWLSLSSLWLRRHPRSSAHPWPSSHSAFCCLGQLHLTPFKHYHTAEHSSLLRTTKQARLSSSTSALSQPPISTLHGNLSPVPCID